MRLRRILYAGAEGRTCRIRPEIYKLEILFVLLTKDYSGRASSDRVHVEFDGSIAEHDVFEYRIAAVEPHQAVKETELPQELRVLFNLPVVGRHGDCDGFRAVGNWNCGQKA